MLFQTVTTNYITSGRLWCWVADCSPQGTVSPDPICLSVKYHLSVPLAFRTALHSLKLSINASIHGPQAYLHVNLVLWIPWGRDEANGEWLMEDEWKLAFGYVWCHVNANVTPESFGRGLVQSCDGRFPCTFMPPTFVCRCWHSCAAHLVSRTWTSAPSGHHLAKPVWMCAHRE